MPYKTIEKDFPEYAKKHEPHMKKLREELMGEKHKEEEEDIEVDDI